MNKHCDLHSHKYRYVYKESNTNMIHKGLPFGSRFSNMLFNPAKVPLGRVEVVTLVFDVDEDITDNSITGLCLYMITVQSNYRLYTSQVNFHNMVVANNDHLDLKHISISISECPRKPISSFIRGYNSHHKAANTCA